jgi:hypothetical protein
MARTTMKRLMKRFNIHVEKLPGGVEWSRPGVGRVFASSSRMSAVLTLDGAHGFGHRAVAAKVFRLAALVSEASAAEGWVIHVDADSDLVVEMRKDTAPEQDRAVRLLVKLLESVS